MRKLSAIDRYWIELTLNVALASYYDLDQAAELVFGRWGHEGVEQVGEWWSFAIGVLTEIEADAADRSAREFSELSAERRRLLEDVRASTAAINAIEDLQAMPDPPPGN